ncbi:MAG TPA: alkyl sulfatase dimerization domain-containing protein [Acidimicrobiales bacterium]|nr:alkyl sulfatase dimerization domain-containing protein [Acidimicrobiales bacterium]
MTDRGAAGADDVDRLIDERPGKELLTPAYDDPARRVHDVVYRSGGTTAAYMLVTGEGRVIVNTGMGYEAPHHRRVFDAVCPGPTPYVITTQAHVDHVGGVELFREPGTRYVAQAANRACQHDDERIAALRRRTAAIWFDVSGRRAREIAAENPGVPMRQDAPVPDVTFDRRLGLSVGGLDLELISTPGGETLDSCIVWLPQHGVCLISNMVGPLFPHFPNLNTLRGDRYRTVEPYLAALRTVRDLQPSVLVTGRHEPIVGRDLIDRALARLHDAVDYVHCRTLAGMNDGKDVATLVREIRLPDELRVGQGYGTVAWGVRTIWESYMGWFRLRSTTELYPLEPVAAAAELVDLAGPDAVVGRARTVLAAGDPVTALHLAEAVLHRRHDHGGAVGVMVDAHRALLDGGGDVNFWESGWLQHQWEYWRSRCEPSGNAQPET